MTVLALAAGCSSGMSVGREIDAEVKLVNQALATATATTIASQDPERGFFAVTWSWRLHSLRPASPLRQALAHALEPRFACASERRHVRCSRALGGDALHLDVAAHPAQGGTLVRAELRATPY